MHRLRQASTRRRPAGRAWLCLGLLSSVLEEGHGRCHMIADQVLIRFPFPAAARRWGEEWTLMVAPIRAVRAFRLLINSPDYLVTSFKVAAEEALAFPAHSALFGAAAFGSELVLPILYPPSRFELRVQSFYSRPRRPWISGSRRERKAKRATFWRRELERAPSELRAALLCRPLA